MIMSGATVNPSPATSSHHGEAASMHTHVNGNNQYHHQHHAHHHHNHQHDDHHRKSEEMDAEHELDDPSDPKPRKKRRVVKTSDKKFECPQPDCGKSYSRAEHLYRHQLNHTPKQIYYCDFPGCERQFVRADLCARHKERHSAKGSHLQRKDAFLNSQRAAAAAVASNSNSGNPSSDSSPSAGMKASMESNHAMQPPPSRAADGYVQQPGMLQSVPPPSDPYQPQAMPNMNALQSEAVVPSLDPQLGPQYNGYPANYGSNPPMMPPPQSPNTAGRRFSYDGGVPRPPQANGSYAQNQPMPVNAMHPPMNPQQQAENMYGQTPQYASHTPNSHQYRPPTSYSNMTVVSSYNMPHEYPAPPGSSRSNSVMSPPNMTSNEQFQMQTSRPNNSVDFGYVDHFSGFAMPVFGHDFFNRSPPATLDDNLLTHLYEIGGIENIPAPSSPPPESMQPYQANNSHAQRFESERSFSNEPVDKEDLHRNSPQVNGLNINIPESDINVKKQNRILTLLGSFEDIDGPGGGKMKSNLLSGDTSDPTHTLSIHMLRTYITSYWVNIHQQMPVLHRPTFNPETCPDLLLLAMVCLGACCLERRDMQEDIPQVADLAYFAAYHIRWEVFKDVEFRPTAKLWTFQTMLLLELYEKMYSTRTLHERAHIHHATTLTVMRRGSSLIGRSAIENTSACNDPTRTPPGPEGSINTSGQNTSDPLWNRWITTEATRRVAFAAFIIDSTHATLFGHSAVMAPHDIRLPLPCDEALWSATSMNEVQRVEASLAANGFKQTSFIDGLRKTLAGEKVRTNTFGRVILMAGLLNVSWHMNQRDLQVTSLRASNTLGNPTRWRSPLTRAFDNWRRDFDDSLSKNDHWLRVCTAKDKCSIDHRENVFESRTCLHSLAHMAMHVDIVDCEVFAGSDRALGRIVTEADRVSVQRKMRETWAPSARARDATFYALRFLCEVLIPDDNPHPSDKTKPPTSVENSPAVQHPPYLRGNKPISSPILRYSAKDDYLLNRPYILYFACMIVWSYGYALDGSLFPRASTPQHHGLDTPEQQARDMHQYLLRIGSVSTPDDLEKVQDRNACVGLLLLLQNRFKQPRWELLHEASDMLGACVKLLLSGPSSSNTGGKDGGRSGAVSASTTPGVGMGIDMKS